MGNIQVTHTAVLPPGGGGLLRHPEGVRLPFRPQGADLREREGGAANLLHEGKRQTDEHNHHHHPPTPSPGAVLTRNTLTNHVFFCKNTNILLSQTNMFIHRHH